MGSYVLVSYQSQTCSSLTLSPAVRREPPWLAEECSPRVGGVSEVKLASLRLGSSSINGGLRLGCSSISGGSRLGHSSISRPCRRMWRQQEIRERDAIICRLHPS